MNKKDAIEIIKVLIDDLECREFHERHHSDDCTKEGYPCMKCQYQNYIKALYILFPMCREEN